METSRQEQLRKLKCRLAQIDRAIECLERIRRMREARDEATMGTLLTEEEMPKAG